MDMTSLQNTFCSRATPAELLDTVSAFKGTAVLTQSVACNISSVTDCHNATLHKSFFPHRRGVLVVLGTQALQSAFV